MNEEFFKTDFNFEKYINARLLEVTDENERRALKEVLKATLLPFYENTEASFKELEKNIHDTMHPKQGTYDILTCIANKTSVDVTEEALVPMRYDDLSDMQIDVEEMMEALKEGKSFPIMRVFLQADYSIIHRLILERRSWRGTIYTTDGSYSGKFIWKQNLSYLKQITDIYQVFQENGLAWKTVCAPYLFKFFDVEILETDCPEDEEITRISVDFEEYEENVIYDLIPMWNLRTVEQRTSAYPNFAIDQIHYEHIIYGERLRKNRDYLVTNQNLKIWNIYRQDGDLHIICDSDNLEKFKLFEFVYEAKEKTYEYEVFHNSSETQGKRCVHTLADVKRFVAGLGYQDRLELIDVRVQDEYEEMTRLTYMVDKFLEDEIRVGKQREALVMVFAKKNGENNYNQDIMSYLVSRVQWEIPEFKCVGEFQ